MNNKSTNDINGNRILRRLVHEVIVLVLIDFIFRVFCRENFLRPSSGDSILDNDILFSGMNLNSNIYLYYLISCELICLVWKANTTQ